MQMKSHLSNNKKRLFTFESFDEWMRSEEGDYIRQMAEMTPQERLNLLVDKVYPTLMSLYVQGKKRSMETSSSYDDIFVLQRKRT